MADKPLIVRLAGDDTALDRALGRSRNKLSRWATGVKRDLAPILRGAFEGLGTIAGFAGVAGIAAAGRQVFDFEKRLMRVGIQGDLTADKIAGIRKEIYAAATAKGVDPDEVLGGVEKYISLTGNIAEARQQIELFATVAGATGASVDDIAQSAAALAQSMGVTGAELSLAFDIMLTQGKAGAVELKDMARLLPKLSGQFKEFGTNGNKGLAEMGAMLQVVRNNFGSADEAATGFQALMSALSKKAGEGKLAGLGINAFTQRGGVKSLRDMTDIIDELIKKTKKDPTVLQKLLGREEAYNAFLAIRDHRQEMEKLIDTTAAAGANQRDHAKYIDSAAGAAERLKAAFKETFSGVFAGNLKNIVSSFKTLLEVVKYLAEHPMLALAGYGALKFGAGGGLVGGFGGGRAGGAAGALAGAAGGIQKVFVVNMGPGGVGGGAGIPGVPGGQTGGPRGVGPGGYLGAIVGGLVVGEQLFSGNKVAGSDVGTAILGGLAVGGPLGALVAGSLAGGAYLGGALSTSEYSGGTAVAGDREKYGDFTNDMVATLAYPDEILEMARKKVGHASDEMASRGGHIGPWAPGSGAGVYGPQAGNQSIADYAAMRRAIIDGMTTAMQGIQLSLALDALGNLTAMLVKEGKRQEGHMRAATAGLRW